MSNMYRFSFTREGITGFHPPYKAETNNSSGKVPIQFLISIKSSLKWALGESSLTKLMFLCIMGFLVFYLLQEGVGGITGSLFILPHYIAETSIFRGKVLINS